MPMKTTILRLIQDDIKYSRLVHTLAKLGIDATNYHSGNSTVIFNLMAIPLSDTLLDAYYRLLEKGNDLEAYATHEQLTALSEEVWGYLTEKV